MASSGIPVDPGCKTTFEELKQRKKHKYIIYSIVDSTIRVLKTSTNPDYAELQKDLPADECRWAVYDAYVELKDGVKSNKICFISWIPTNARDNKDKFIYSTSKGDFRKALGEGIFAELQATDADEVDQSSLEYKLQGKLIQS